jgi:hypothetical protein
MKYLLYLYLSLFLTIPITKYFFPDYTKEVSLFALLVAVVFQIAFILFMKKKVKVKVKIEDKANDLLDPAFDGIEFDNDFKKVPAGDDQTPPNQIPNYLNPSIFKEVDDNLKENLKRIGLEDIKSEKKDTNK